ncbi:MAG: tetratricopeptide repeat protein [Planctomycetota bacterium]|jgi:tetratricopeptide (TPR) repeat protein
MRPIAFVAPLLLALPYVAGLAQVVDPRDEAKRLTAHAVALMEGERHHEAIKALVRAAKLDPKDVHIPFYLAQCELNLAIQERYPARFERAREYLKQAKSIDPSYGGTAFIWGLVGIEAGKHETAKYKDAVEGFREALALKFEPLRSQGNLATALFLWGTERAKQEDYHEPEEVIAILEEARRRLRDLKDDLRIGVDERKRFEEYWLLSQANLAALHQARANYPVARALLENLIRLQPKNPLHYYHLALLFGDGRQWKEALANHHRALQVAPDFLESHLKMGWIYSQLGQGEKATRHFRIYLDAHPESWEGHQILGDHYVGVGKYEDAIREFRRCVEIDRDAFAAIYKLGLALRRVKRTRESDMWIALYGILDREKED